MSTRRSNTTYAAIRTEGGLLPPDLLDRIQKLDASLGGLHPADYHLAENSRLNSEITESWQAIQAHFASFRRTRVLVEREHGTGTSETRAWVQQVLRELGFRELRFVPGAEAVDGRSFLISHRAGETDNAPPVHIISFEQGLDERAGRTGGGEQRSPHALMQGFLNASDHLWGVVTNGLVFRLLRENRQIDRSLRVEFDLEGILESTSFAEFRLFWLILHRSRFVQPGERRESAWLERWSMIAASEGTRALTGLRDGVETAIEALGQGLLSHPGNVHLRDQLANGELTVDAYYSELLRLVYRLLFLLVAEERGLLFAADIEPHVIGRYRKHYSIERLREEVTRVRTRDAHHDDLWRGLLVTFDAMRYPKEAKALGLAPLGGGLFGSGSCPHVADEAAPGIPEDGERTAGRPMLANAALLDAIQALSEVTRDGATRRINYRDLDVEELGSVYEGLLEHRPALEPMPNGGYRFGFSASTSRKETGSYYTPRSLVQELLNSALDPVIEDALKSVTSTAAQERALLDLNVCDPACGSGHFLLGAARRIGRRLAEVRAGVDREPEPGDVRRATSEAIRHCVYGVDKNPLAIDLCKTALWIESHEPGGPIGFLDHHVKRGDSLVGVFDLDVLQSGIPDEAYSAVTGDEKTVASDMKKRNRAERSKLTVLRDGMVAPVHNVGLFEEGDREDILKALAAELDLLDAMSEHTVDEVQEKAAAYERLTGRDGWQALSTACDLWTWAFFAPLTKQTLGLVPTSATVRRMVEQGTVPGNITGQARTAAENVGFFHWRLAFPEVFRTWSAGGGFDAVLGNPPWERVKLQEKEFFAEHDPAIATAPNKAARDRLIKKLPETNPTLAQAFEDAKCESENASLFMRTSGRFPRTGRGDVNLYSVFAEQFRGMIRATGRAGIIVPTGIATDDTNRYFFADIVNKASLAALYDFENRKAIFEGVHRSYKFSIMVLAGAARQDARFRAGFFLLDPAEIQEQDKTFALGADDIALVNPVTKTCPIVRTPRDMDLLIQLHKSAALFEDGDWGGYYIRLVDLGDHAEKVRFKWQLQDTTKDSFGNLHDHEGRWLRLWEAKLFTHYDHRHATFEGTTEQEAASGNARAVTLEEHQDPDFHNLPRYWVNEAFFESLLGKYPDQGGWLLAYRDICRSTDERTCIPSIIPLTPATRSTPCVGVKQPHKRHLLAANLSTFCLDFAARQKVAGTHLNFGTFKQLPILPPDAYDPDVSDLIARRILELTYTAHDLEPFARDLGYMGEPFIWDEKRRTTLRAELDGIYAHLYGISREDFAYILDTFPIVARKDIAKYGEYRTKRLCLKAYDHFAPETLRALELEVREIEVKLRRTIVTALSNDPASLPSDIRAEILEERAKHRANGSGDGDPSLRELLDSAYMRHLYKLIRSDGVWPKVQDQFDSKSQFEKHFGRLNTFRNPLAHGRSVDEEVRRKGEDAIAWFRERLAVTA